MEKWMCQLKKKKRDERRRRKRRRRDSLLNTHCWVLGDLWPMLVMSSFYINYFSFDVFLFTEIASPTGRLSPNFSYLVSSLCYTNAVYQSSLWLLYCTSRAISNWTACDKTMQAGLWCLQSKCRTLSCVAMITSDILFQDLSRILFSYLSFSLLLVVLFSIYLYYQFF